MVPDEDDLATPVPLPPSPVIPEPGPSDGGTLPDCSNGTTDGAETGIDCGGPCGPCPSGDPCLVDHDCETESCQAGKCDPAEPGDGDCIDMGPDGNNVTVPTDACVRVLSGYPEWWNTRPMQVQVVTAGAYPVMFQWSNACSGGGGTGQFTYDWQNQILSPTNESISSPAHVG